MTVTRACGATSPRVLGRCGRDRGHEGDHRSTGPTYEVWFRGPSRFTPPPEPLPYALRSSVEQAVLRIVKAQDAAFVLAVLPVLAAHPNLLHYLAGRPVWGAYAGAHGRRSLARRGLA